MAHGDVTVAFFDFLSENHDYIVFYSTEWPPDRQNPIFYSVFGGPSRPEVHVPEGQNPRKVAFLKKKLKNRRKHKNRQNLSWRSAPRDVVAYLAGGGSPGAPSRARPIIDKSIS